MNSRRAHASAINTVADITEAVARGKADVEAGPTIDAAEAFAELEAYFCAMARESTAAVR